MYISSQSKKKGVCERIYVCVRQRERERERENIAHSFWSLFKKIPLVLR